VCGFDTIDEAYAELVDIHSLHKELGVIGWQFGQSAL
jgi:hypothetical protein